MYKNTPQKKKETVNNKKYCHKLLIKINEIPPKTFSRKMLPRQVLMAYPAKKISDLM